MKTKFFPYLKFYKVIDSTNLEAKRMLDKNKFQENFVLISKIQTKGTGRLKRKWYSDKGGLWYSLVLKNKQLKPDVTLFTGIILHKTILNFYDDIPIWLRWPNDIYLNNMKIAGILSLQYKKSTIIGIGININQKSFKKELKNIATSIFLETGKRLAIKKFLKSFLLKFFDEYQKYTDMGLKLFLDYYKNFDYLFGKKISVTHNKNVVIGYALGINKQGELIVKKGKKKLHYLTVDKIDII